MQVAMLGPLEVRTDGDPGKTLEVGGVRLRALLIMLALRPGQFVPASQLIDGLWAEAAPAEAANALQALVSRLRRALPEAVIESRPAGYQLALDPQATDIVRFEQLAGDLARLDGEPSSALAHLLQAMELASHVNVALQIRAIAATSLGYLTGAEGDLDAARRWHDEALDIARSAADAPVIAQALVGLADLGLREGDPAWSATLLGASVSIRGTIDRSAEDEARVASVVTARLINLMNETTTTKAIQALQIPSVVTGFDIGTVLRAKLTKLERAQQCTDLTSE